MSNKPKFSIVWKYTVTSIITIAGLIGAIAGFTTWIHYSAQQAVLDENFLATLAARVRPTCIFNSRGAVEADFGASDYVENIQVTPEPEEYGYKITIKAKRFLAYPPLITGLDVDLFPQKETREEMCDWEIELAPNSTASEILAANGMDTNAMHRFKMEILH